MVKTKRKYPTFNQFSNLVDAWISKYSKPHVFKSDKKSRQYKQMRKLYNKAMKKLYKRYEKQ